MELRTKLLDLDIIFQRMKGTLHPFYVLHVVRDDAKDILESLREQLIDLERVKKYISADEIQTINTIDKNFVFV